MPDNKIHSELRTKYLQTASKNSCPPFIVGVSWRGGGRPDRIKQKSLDSSDFYRILSSFPNVQFVSLQYGDVSLQCDEWSKAGIHIICDNSVNAMKDMDRWLAQVHACDAVLSVANTTIHGAGGLHKPTLCLLSQHSDWRWFNDCRLNVVTGTLQWELHANQKMVIGVRPSASIIVDFKLMSYTSRTAVYLVTTFDPHARHYFSI